MSAPLQDTADPLRFDDRVVVVTGAAAGLGRRTAEHFALLGASVALLDVDEAAAAEAAAELSAAGHSARAVLCDVSDEPSVAAAAERVQRELGRCDVLVNNAAVLLRAALEEETADSWDRVLAVNLGGAFLCSRAFGRAMLDAGGGSIVNVASIAAEHPTPRTAAYCASKAGVLALTRQAALEWGPGGVRVNAVSPAYMRTSMTEEAYRTSGIAERRAALVPVGRIADLDEVARVITFLASPAAGYLNGVAVTVDGGLTQTLATHTPRA